MDATKKILKSLFTDRDNETQDIMKWLAAIAFVVAVGLTIYEVVFRKMAFDIIIYSTGVAALMGTLAAATRWKDPVTPAAPVVTVSTPPPQDKTIESVEVKSTTTTTTSP